MLTKKQKINRRIVGSFILILGTFFLAYSSTGEVIQALRILLNVVSFIFVLFMFCLGIYLLTD